MKKGRITLLKLVTFPFALCAGLATLLLVLALTLLGWPPLLYFCNKNGSLDPTPYGAEGPVATICVGAGTCYIIQWLGFLSLGLDGQIHVNSWIGVYALFVVLFPGVAQAWVSWSNFLDKKLVPHLEEEI